MICLNGISLRFQLFLVVSISLQVTAAENAQFGKTKRTSFDMKEIRRFISHELSRPYSSGSLVELGDQTRTVRGQVVDHAGKPLPNCYVAIVERIGYSGDCFDENFDKTDSLGRFVVEGHLNRIRLVVRNQDGKSFAVNLDEDQSEVLVTWPAPATCNIQIPETLCPKDAPVRLFSTHYWVGMASMQITGALVDGQASIQNLLPADYSVCVQRVVELNEKQETRWVDVGTFSVEAGEGKQIALSAKGKRIVRGQITLPNVPKLVTLTVQNQKRSYRHVPQAADFVLCKNGQFETAALSPGNYTFVFQGPPPKPNPKAAVRLGFFGRNRGWNYSYRLKVSEGDEPMEIVLPAKQEDTNPLTRFVENVLTSRPTGSWSHTDVQVAQLIRHEDREAITDELFRIFRSKETPFEWQYPTVVTLGKMSSSPRVVDFLIAEMRKTQDIERKAKIIRALQDSATLSDEIISELDVLRQTATFPIRSAAMRTLRLQLTKDTKRIDRIAQILIDGLADSDEQTRIDIVADLGRHGINDALPVLKEARKDPSAKVRVWAAWAIWKLTGDQEQAEKLMTQQLFSKTLSGKWEAAYLLADFEDLSPITVKGLQAATRIGKELKYANRISRESRRIRSAAETTLKKLAAKKTLKVTN